MKKILLLIVLALVFGGPLLLLLLSSQTEMRLEEPVRVIGVKTPIQVRVANPHGIRRMEAWVEQGGVRHNMYESREPATRFWFWRKSEPPRQVSFAAGKSRAAALRDGRARLVIEAQGNDFRAQTASLAVDVEVNTRPPALSVDGAQHYINQGGAELVVFTPSGYWTEAGVRVGKYTFRSYPMPGSTGERFCLLGFPWDLPADTAPVVYARNPAGAEARARFWFKVFPKKFRSRELELSDAFLQKVVDELDPSGEGDLLPRFLKINGEMRRKNNQELADLRLKTEEKVLWSGPFLQLGNSQVESQFADSRTYVYRGKVVDHQTHLGFDLAVTQHVPVAAANDGRVVHAGSLGIYGNCIVVDHGYALQSIYAHLSTIDVKPGDLVKKGQAMGKSGATGLAGGDHLHFSMQLDGAPVNPVEWWDEHWIQDHILSRLK
jgi:murein DD-endopeptidase MepM/ murein hydrolase activator NlpD